MLSIGCKLEQHIPKIDLFVASNPISGVKEDIAGGITIYRYNIYKASGQDKFILKGTDQFIIS